jgi:hypothetical protein
LLTLSWRANRFGKPALKGNKMNTLDPSILETLNRAPPCRRPLIHFVSQNTFTSQTPVLKLMTGDASTRQVTHQWVRFVKAISDRPVRSVNSDSAGEVRFADCISTGRIEHPPLGSFRKLFANY